MLRSASPSSVSQRDTGAPARQHVPEALVALVLGSSVFGERRQNPLPQNVSSLLAGKALASK